jgi:hypothetical protein
MRLRFELAAELGQPSEVGELQAKRVDRRRVHRHRQRNAGPGQLVELLELRPLVDLAPDQRPRRLDEPGEAEGSHDLGCWEPREEGHKPLDARRLPVPCDLRKVQRQVVVEQAIGQAFARQRHLTIGLRQFLQVVMPGEQRFVIVLDQAVLQELQDHRRVLGVVLVPRIEHRFPVPRAGDGRHRDHREPLLEEAKRQRPMEIAGGLERHPDGAWEGTKEGHQPAVILGAIRHPEPLLSPVGALDEDRVECLADVDRHE